MSEAVAIDQFEDDFVRPEQFTLIEDERSLTREEVIERYFTPKDEKINGLIREKIVNFPGVGEYANLRPRSSFIMPQIRDEYNANHIERTGRSMRDSEDGQLQNCGVTFVDEEHIDDYLADINDFFGRDIKRSDVPLHPVYGVYIITVFGHNRQLGAAYANREASGHPDRGIPLFAKVFRNPPFWRVIGMQATENTGSPPNAWELSRSIVKFEEYANRDRQPGELPVSQEDLAGVFNVNTGTVWRAKNFESLPDDIKKLVITGGLVYSGAHELVRLKGLFDSEYIVDLARRLSGRELSGKQVLDEINRRVVVSDLSPEIFALVEDGAINLDQAKQLALLKQAGDNPDHIDEVAVYISTRRPDQSELKRVVRDRIEKIQLGMGTIWSGESSTFANNDGMESLRRDDLREHVVRDLRDATRAIHGVSSIYRAGMAGTAADAAVVAGVIDDNLIDSMGRLLTLDNQAEISPEALGTIMNGLESLKTRIGQTALPPDVRRAFQTIIIDTEDLLTLESTTSSDDQKQLALAAFERIKELRTQGQPVSEPLSLF